MLPKGDENDADRTFNPTTKCCTYHPDIHNFMAGNILADDSPEGYGARRTLERRIAARYGVTPMSVAPPPVYTVLYTNSALSQPHVFGHAASLKCPFYVEHLGQCGVWRHREAVCATFFCKYERGTVGKNFWRTLAAFIGQLEFTLRIWALNQVDPTTTISNACLNAELHKPKGLDAAGLAGVVPPGVYERLWGPYVGREAELYKLCAELVNKLEFAQVLEIGGGFLAPAAVAIQDMHRRLIATELPERITRGANALVQISRTPGKLRLKSGSAPYDHIDVPAEALATATRLVDRPLAQARAELQAAGEEIADETLRALIDFEVVVPA